MKKLFKSWAHFWLIGTIVTFGIAWLLWRRGYPLEGAAVVMISPFPWPGPEA
jgi:hypothetical protein